MVSQSMYDEMLRENQELFEMSNVDAVSETVKQLGDQGVSVSDLERCVVVDHPDSTTGRMERLRRYEFRKWMGVVRDFVVDAWASETEKGVGINGINSMGKNDDDEEEEEGEDSSQEGSAWLEEFFSQGSGGVNANKEETLFGRLEAMEMALMGLSSCCSSGIFIWKKVADTRINNDMDEGMDASKIHEETDNVDNNDDKEKKRIRTLACVTALLHDDDKIGCCVPSLFYILSVSIRYQYCSPSTLSLSSTKFSRKGNEAAARLSRLVADALVSILSTRRSGHEEDVRRRLRDRFGSKSSLLPDLIGTIMQTVQKYDNITTLSSSSSSSSLSPSLSSLLLVADLLRLGTAICRGSERNKSSIVRGSDTLGRDCSSILVSVLVKASQRMLVKASQRIISPQVDCTKTDDVRLATDACRLITVLCRYDGDFRTPDDDKKGPEASLPVGAGGGASSGHDRAMDLVRCGVIPVILILIRNFQGLDETKTIDKIDNNNDKKAIDVESGSHESELQTNVEEGRVGDTSISVPATIAAMSAARALATGDGAVQSFHAGGILNLATRALRFGCGLECNQQDNDDSKDDTSCVIGDGCRPNARLAAVSLGLLRNLCGNDGVKTILCLGVLSSDRERHPTLPLVLRAMEIFSGDARCSEHGLGVLAAMALRKPENAIRIASGDGPMRILAAMRCHCDDALVRRQGALAIRNVVCRIPVDEGDEGGCSSRAAFLDLGAEVVLRDAASASLQGGRNGGGGCVDEAYAALRDLGCKVEIITVDAATGSYSRGGAVAFGDTNPNFRPVYDDQNDHNDSKFGSRVDEAMKRYS